MRTSTVTLGHSSYPKVNSARQCPFIPHSSLPTGDINRLEEPKYRTDLLHKKIRKETVALEKPIPVMTFEYA